MESFFLAKVITYGEEGFRDKVDLVRHRMPWLQDELLFLPSKDGCGEGLCEETGEAAAR
jgi:hypothetical protein